MKKNVFQLIVLFALLLSGVKAQNLIAVQNGGSSAFYSNLDSAILHSNTGDSLFLPGGFVPTAGVIKINKAIHIIGVGYNLDSTTVTGNTILQKNIEILKSVNGGSITGIYGYGYSISIHDTVSNFKINRCYFSSIYIGSGLGQVPASNITITETVVNDYIYGMCLIPGITPINVCIYNCFLGYMNVYKGGPIVSLSNNYYPWKELIVKNSILFGGSNYYGNRFFTSIPYSVFENCVFIDVGLLPTGSTNNTFRNCIFNGPSTTDYIAAPPSNLIYNCIFNQNADSIFINRQGNNFSINSNYHLLPTSPGKNAGKDGTDIGIYGGVSPWKVGSVPFNPHFQTSQIGSTTNPSGNLNVHIKVAAQDH